MKLMISALLAACVQASTGIAAEKPRVFTCDVSSYGKAAQRSWIPAKALFEVYSGKKEVKMALAFGGEKLNEPRIVESVSGFGSNIITLKWTFRNAETSGSYEVTMEYTARLNMKRKSATIRAWPRGFDDNISGKAKCSVN